MNKDIGEIKFIIMSGGCISANMLVVLFERLNLCYNTRAVCGRVKIYIKGECMMRRPRVKFLSFFLVSD